MRLRANPNARKAGRRKRGRQRLELTPRTRRTAAVLLAGSALAALWLTGLPKQFAQFLGREAVELTADLGLRVEDVLVEGRRHSDGADILAALGVERGTAMLAIDPVAAKASLESLPWVREAVVERRLPRVLYLRLIEREPIALWQLEGRLSVIDRDGTVIRGADPRHYARLPLVVGEGAAERAQNLIALLASEGDLAKRVKAAVLVGGRRWNIELDNGVSVRLPEHSPGEAWTQLGRIVREEALLERDVVVIDLRVPDRLILRTTSGEAPPPPEKEPEGRGQST